MTESEAKRAWNVLIGKQIKGVRPTHDDDSPIPSVNLTFTDGTAAHIVVGDAYFEACLINTLRKSQPICSVEVMREFPFCWTVQLVARSFPLLVLRASRSDEFPFEMNLGIDHG